MAYLPQLSGAQKGGARHPPASTTSSTSSDATVRPHNATPRNLSPDSRYGPLPGASVPGVSPTDREVNEIGQFLDEKAVLEGLKQKLETFLAIKPPYGLLWPDVVEVARSDMQICGNALCMLCLAFETTSEKPVVTLPPNRTYMAHRKGRNSSTMELNENTCPPSLKPHFNNWVNLVPRIKTLQPRFHSDIARVICELDPKEFPLVAQVNRIAADLRNLAIELSFRQTFLDTFDEDVLAALSLSEPSRVSTLSTFIRRREHDRIPEEPSESGDDRSVASSSSSRRGRPRKSTEPVSQINRTGSVQSGSVLEDARYTATSMNDGVNQTIQKMVSYGPPRTHINPSSDPYKIHPPSDPWNNSTQGNPLKSSLNIQVDHQTFSHSAPTSPTTSAMVELPRAEPWRSWNETDNIPGSLSYAYPSPSPFRPGSGSRANPVTTVSPVANSQKSRGPRPLPPKPGRPPAPTQQDSIFYKTIQPLPPTASDDHFHDPVNLSFEIPSEGFSFEIPSSVPGAIEVPSATDNDLQAARERYAASSGSQSSLSSGNHEVPQTSNPQRHNNPISPSSRYALPNMPLGPPPPVPRNGSHAYAPARRNETPGESNWNSPSGWREPPEPVNHIPSPKTSGLFSSLFSGRPKTSSSRSSGEDSRPGTSNAESNKSPTNLGSTGTYPISPSGSSVGGVSLNLYSVSGVNTNDYSRYPSARASQDYPDGSSGSRPSPHSRMSPSSPESERGRKKSPSGQIASPVFAEVYQANPIVASAYHGASSSRSRNESRLTPDVLAIREMVYSAVAEALAIPALANVILKDPQRAFFSAMSLAILSVSVSLQPPANDAPNVIIVSSRHILLSELPGQYRTSMKEFADIGQEARKLGDEDDERAIECVARGKELPEPRMSKVRKLIERGMGYVDAKGRVRGSTTGTGGSGRSREFANRINALSLELLKLPAFNERDEVFKILMGGK